MFDNSMCRAARRPCPRFCATFKKDMKSARTTIEGWGIYDLNYLARGMMLKFKVEVNKASLDLLQALDFLLQRLANVMGLLQRHIFWEHNVQLHKEAHPEVKGLRTKPVIAGPENEPKRNIYPDGVDSLDVLAVVAANKSEPLEKIGRRRHSREELGLLC